MNQHFDVIIVGGGPAGLTAALYARRAGHTALVLEKEGFGGQIASAPRVENFPGTPALCGAELSDRLYSQAEGQGACLELETVLEVRDGPVKTVVTDYNVYTCAALILATGMKRGKLGLPGEDTLSGISYCAVCDGAFYRDRDVAVCGGGNTALQDTLFLSRLCRSVTLIHRRSAFRGDAVLAEQVSALPNVRLALNAQITGLLGDGALTGLRLRFSDGSEAEPALSGLFVAVGQRPEISLTSTLLPLDSAGFLPAGEDCRTQLPGVFAAGDCRAKSVRQLTTACADGAVAALAACRYCERVL